jgi:hypothetical protein
LRLIFLAEPVRGLVNYKKACAPKNEHKNLCSRLTLMNAPEIRESAANECEWRESYFRC